MIGPAVFLDRDGVLNEAVVRDGKPHPPRSAAEAIILPDTRPALMRLVRAGYRLVVVTNQPDVARGLQTREEVDAINAKLAAALPIDEFRVCCHDDGDACGCRKPAPGLLLREPIHDMPRSVIVGDRWRDIEAGRRAGVGGAVLIDRGYRETMTVEPDVRVGSLDAAADWILSPERSVPLSALRVKLFSDTASPDEMRRWASHPLIRGFTTNPTLMRKAGIDDYERFAREALAAIRDRPVSFEVFSDEFDEMAVQARAIGSWGANVFVKIPITNTRGESAAPLITRLTQSGIHVNVTAVLTISQVETAIAALKGGAPSNISVFAGRIADTGRNPMPFVAAAVDMTASEGGIEVIWASPREVLNVYQADAVGCHIITATPDVLQKLELSGRDLGDFSLATVKMFRDDAVRSGFALKRTQFA